MPSDQVPRLPKVTRYGPSRMSGPTSLKLLINHSHGCVIRPFLANRQVGELNVKGTTAALPGSGRHRESPRHPATRSFPRSLADDFDLYPRGRRPSNSPYKTCSQGRKSIIPAIRRDVYAVVAKAVELRGRGFTHLEVCEGIEPARLSDPNRKLRKHPH